MQRYRGIDLPVDRNGNPIHIDDYMVFDDGVFKINSLTYLGDGNWIAYDEADTCISDNLSAGIIVDDDFIFQQVELISLCCDMYKFIRGICKDYSHLFVSRIDDNNLNSMPDVVFAMRMRELGIDVNKLEGEV